MMITVIGCLLVATCAVSVIGVAKELGRRRYNRQFWLRLHQVIGGRSPLV